MKKCNKCFTEKELSEFYQRYNKCKECMKLEAKERYKENREKRIAEAKEKYQKNKEAISKKRKEKRASKPIEQKRKEDRARYLKFKDKTLTYKKKYYAKNKSEISEKRKLNRPKINMSKSAYRFGEATPKWLTKEQKMEMLKMYKKAKELSDNASIERAFHVDHIVPLKHDKVCGLNVPWNLQILTKSENSKKCNKIAP